MQSQSSGHKTGSVVDSEESGESVSITPNMQAQRNVELITELERKAIHSRSTAEHVADKIIRGAGSTPFVIFHMLWFGGWILVNTGVIPGVPAFDPFPFSFLTLVVSLEAIFLTLLVLMSQNRMIREADKRAHLDLQLNMLAEQEGTELLKLVQKISRHLGIDEEADEAAQHLQEQTDVHQLAKTLDEQLPG
jgi:uncharacterized membrane protein